MLSQLEIQQCRSCKIGESCATEQEIKQYAEQIPEWQLKQVNQINQLERVYQFKNFASAIAFTNQIAEMAEVQNHHPALLTEWGKVTITWWSHSIKGLHLNDFICAAKTEQIFKQLN
jgi:4a-hydroxytetrahydrobiopterin dehydratase